MANNINKDNLLKNQWFYISVILIMVVSILIITNPINNKNNPEKVIDNLYKAIEVAEDKGGYKCCITPPCTMCYLGHWKFEKGTCYCDDAIIEGRDEDVCPECIKGIEKGFCSSAKAEKCEIT